MRGISTEKEERVIFVHCSDSSIHQGGQGVAEQKEGNDMANWKLRKENPITQPGSYTVLYLFYMSPSS